MNHYIEKAIVLGGTLPHITLIKKLKSRGFYVILVDFLESPIAKEYADIHIKESTLDKNKVLQIAKEHNVKLVISTCVDQANAIACYVSEQLDLPCPYSYSTALDVTDKVRMKDIMKFNNIPTSKYIKITNINQFDKHAFTYPIIIKPTDSNSSKGVYKVENISEDVSIPINKAISISRMGEAIVEEFVEGVEIGVDCFIKNGVATILMIKKRHKITNNNSNIQQIYGCLWPMPVSDIILRNIQSIANNIALAFKLYNTPLMIQAILKGDSVNVIEIGARIGGGESYRIIKEITGFDFVEASIDSFLGIGIDMKTQNSNLFYADNFIYVRKSCFSHIEIDESLLNDGTIYYYSTFKAKHTEIGSDISSNNRVGVFVVKSTSIEELREKTMRVINNMEVYDVEGNPIMRKDIYI